MVGAPGYSSGRSVLVLCPTSPVSPDVLSSVWEEFELNGVLVTFASDTGKIALAVQNIDFSDSSQQLKGVPQPRSQSGAVIDGSLKTRAEAAINLQSALGFRGVSFDGILVIGTSRDDDKPGHQLKYQPTRIPDIILHAVKSNKYVAALGGGIRFLEDVFFKGVPILQGKHVAYMDGHADFYQASGATAVAGEELVRDRRLLTATYQDANSLFKCLREAILKEDGTTRIPPYLQAL